MNNARHDTAAMAGRIRGCVLGGAIGDALGAPIEFDSLQRLRQEFGPRGLTEMPCTDSVALITDDTQLTLFTIEGLIRYGVRLADSGTGATVESAVRQAYQRWLGTQSQQYRHGDHATGWLREQQWLYHRRAPGIACLSGLREAGDGIEQFSQWGRPGPVNSDSKGCGAVMRSAPFGLVGPDAKQSFEVAARCAMYTHGHPTGYLAAGAFAAVIHNLTLGMPLPEAVGDTMSLLAAYPGHEETTAILATTMSLAEADEPTAEKVESLGGAWIAEEALAIGVYCALAALPDSPARGQVGSHDGHTAIQHALLLSVNHSGDSDSTGAICGNLLGAAHGFEALPEGWLESLEHRATITEIADDLAQALREGHTPAISSKQWSIKYPGC